MNRVTKRTWLMCLFLMILLGGMLVFLWEYVTQAEKWVSFSGSPHLYNSSNIGCGTITDRSGNVLLDISQGRTYSDDVNTRKSTLHWLGDRKGFISASTVSTYAGMVSAMFCIWVIISSAAFCAVANRSTHWSWADQM